MTVKELIDLLKTADPEKVVNTGCEGYADNAVQVFEFSDSVLIADSACYDENRKDIVNGYYLPPWEG